MISTSVDGIDLVGVAVRSVTIKLNNRCPLRCRHCSVGFSETYKGDGYKISAENLARTIAAIDPAVYDMALLAGGEPSLDPPLIRVAIDAARHAGLLCAIVTAPVWAATAATADRFLSRVDGIDVLILSYDEYHLEFIDVAQYRRAIEAAAKTRVTIVVHIVYTEEMTRDRLRAHLEDLAPLVHFHESRTVAFGNAADPKNVPMKYVAVHETSDLARIPRGCVLGNSLIDEQGSVHGCCWSRSVPESPFSAALDEAGMGAAMARLEERPAFQSVRAHGFLDGLTEHGREALVERFRGQEFANECDICLKAMVGAPAEIWGQVRDPYSTRVARTVPSIEPDTSL